MLKTLIEIAPSKQTEEKRKEIKSTQLYFDLLCSLVDQYHVKLCSGEGEDDDEAADSATLVATDATTTDSTSNQTQTQTPTQNQPKLQPSDSQVQIDLSSLFLDTVEQLKAYESTEKLGGLTEDRTLFGYLNLTRELLLIQLS